MLVEPGKPIRHFAYGANMCSSVLHRRRGIQPLSATVACAPDYALAFNMPGIRIIEPFFANLVPRPGAVAYGVLYALSPMALQTLRRLEGGAYLDSLLHVRTCAGELVEAHAYVGAANRPEGRPSRRYLRLLIEGAREHDLPGAYLEQLVRTPAVHVPILSDLVALFAFGERLI